MTSIWLDLGAHAEIRKTHLHGLGQETVGGFEVSMTYRYGFRMQIRQTGKNTGDDIAEQRNRPAVSQRVVMYERV